MLSFYSSLNDTYFLFNIKINILFFIPNAIIISLICSQNVIHLALR
jgi:hypothetical protein